MSNKIATKARSSEAQRLESRRYQFVADGTMPVLDFNITSGTASSSSKDKEHLTLEIYNPLSGEVFEAKFGKGRIEVDRDGSVTYFTTSSEKVSFSMFLGRNLSLSLNKSGEVVIRTPSKILSIEKQTETRNQDLGAQVTSDSIKLLLE